MRLHCCTSPSSRDNICITCFPPEEVSSYFPTAITLRQSSSIPLQSTSSIVPRTAPSLQGYIITRSDRSCHINVVVFSIQFHPEGMFADVVVKYIHDAVVNRCRQFPGTSTAGTTTSSFMSRGIRN